MNNNNNRRKPSNRKNNQNSKVNRHKSNSNKNNRRRRSHGHQKLSGLDKVEKSYFNLLEKHLEARKKYFELYHRADLNQLRKLEKSFYNTLYELRNYLDGLDDELKQKFNQRFDPYKEDHTYTLNHGLSPAAEHIPHSESYEDPHLLQSQKADYSQDTEESAGTIDDYKLYKGL